MKSGTSPILRFMTAIGLIAAASIVKSRTSPILRLMAAIGLIAAALALLRAGTPDEFWLGELVPFSLIGLFGMALALVTDYRICRFFAGFAATGVLVGLAFWVSPSEFRQFVLARVILPIDARISPQTAGLGMAYLKGWHLLPVIETPVLRTTRCPFWSRESQVALGFLEGFAAVIGGLLAAIRRPGTARRTLTIDP